MRRHRAELSRRSPVYGLQLPDLAPRTLGASNSIGVTLYAGELQSAVGPLVGVRTAQPRPVGLREPSVPDQLADEHDRLYEHTDVDEPEEEATQAEGALHVADAVLPAEVHRESLLWAARAVVVPDSESPVVVTVVSRGVPLEEVQLTLIDDLEPYWAGRETLMAALADRHPLVRLEDLDLPATHGLDAHRALVEYCLRDTAERRARLSAGRRPQRRRGAGDERQRLWEAAVRAQGHPAEQGRHEANEHVTQIVNQLTTLAGASAWFEDARLRTAAIDQVLGYHVFGADVPTSEAQRTWQRARAGRRTLATPDLRFPEHVAARRRAVMLRLELEREAQRAWDEWASGA